MKNIYYCFYAAIFLCFVSCSNETTEKNEPVKSAPASTPPATPPANEIPQTPVKKEQVEVKKTDTSRTEITIGQQGGSIKTKKGTGVSLDKNGIKVGSKDVKIDIKKDTNP